MSAEQQREPWIAPQTFREAVNDLVTISQQLRDLAGSQIVVTGDDVDFLTRRLNRLAVEVRRALPPEVS